MTATRAELITEVLTHLHVIGAEETATAADSALVGRYADRLLTEMQTRDLDHDYTSDLTTVFTLSAIPDTYVYPMTMILAYRCARSFGKDEQEIQVLRREAQEEGWNAIYRIQGEQIEDRRIAIEAALEAGTITEHPKDSAISAVPENDPVDATYY